MAIVDGHIRCNRCGEMKPLNEFAPSYAKRGDGRCRLCCRQTAPGGKAWKETASPDELERQRAKGSEYYRKNKSKLLLGARARQLAAYGITIGKYEEMLEEQNGRCACCGTADRRGSGRLHVDHDHETGQVRGLICHNCNQGLGLFGDTLAGLRNAVAYLERAQWRGAPALRINLLRAAYGR